MRWGDHICYMGAQIEGNKGSNRCHFEAIMKLCWSHFGASLRSSGAILGLFWGQFEVIWSHFGAILGPG